MQLNCSRFSNETKDTRAKLRLQYFSSLSVRSRASWWKQAHQKNSESCTSLKLHSVQLCIFSVSLKVWFDIRFDVTAVFAASTFFFLFCGGLLGLFMCWSLMLKPKPAIIRQFSNYRVVLCFWMQQLCFCWLFIFSCFVLGGGFWSIKDAKEQCL